MDKDDGEDAPYKERGVKLDSINTERDVDIKNKTNKKSNNSTNLHIEKIKQKYFHFHTHKHQHRLPTGVTIVSKFYIFNYFFFFLCFINK